MFYNSKQQEERGESSTKAIKACQYSRRLQ